MLAFLIVSVVATPIFMVCVALTHTKTPEVLLRNMIRSPVFWIYIVIVLFLGGVLSGGLTAILRGLIDNGYQL